MDKLKDNLAFAIVLALIVGFGVEMFEAMPDNAIVFVDKSTKTYFGYTTGLEEKSFGRELMKSTYSEARAKGYEPDKLSEAREEFMGYDRKLITYCLAKIGLLPDLHRWNSDGTWNY